MVRLQTDPIRADDLIAAVRSDEDGAVAVFLGTVRNHNRGRRVERLDYTAYAAMAEREMAAIVDQARARFSIGRVAAVHRTGTLAIGEVSVGVAVAAPHRAAAFDACRYVIDSLKRSVPIWKKEIFQGGEEWIEGGG